MSFSVLFFILLPLAILLVAVVIKGIKILGGFRFGHITLNCPHCGAETPAQLATCWHCGKELS